MADLAAIRRPEVIATNASSSFVCDYVAGVNRVLSLPPYLLVDNIGRNFETWRFQSGSPEPSARALYDLTSYPDDPMASLLDVDIHAAFLRRDGGELLAVNHYGRVRGFELPATAARLQPAWERQLLGDTERIVMAGDCFVASSPRGEFTNDPAQPGIILFEPIAAPPGPASGGTERLDYVRALADWGVVGALAVPAAGDRLAVAAGLRLGVFALARSGSGLRLGDCLWETSLGFHCQWLHVDETGRLWAGGHRPASRASEDWDACHGGGIDTFAAETGNRLFTTALPEATTWGYGADPIALALGGREIYVLGRDASLHAVDVATGVWQQLYGALLDEPASLAAPALGIGHAALHGEWLYAGFSRGGFRLLRYDLRPA